MTKTTVRSIHPLWVRLGHWINALAMITMILSGWRIYNASPLFTFSFPGEITLGAWLGGALQWHFAAMWIFVVNGVIYLSLNIFTRRFSRRFFPLNIHQLYRDFSHALRGRLSHESGSYNMIQKVAYLLAIFSGGLLVVSGLVLWKSVQFPLLREIVHGYNTARYIHFFSMAFVCFFILIHILMVIIVPKTLLTMIRGR